MLRLMAEFCQKTRLLVKFKREIKYSQSSNKEIFFFTAFHERIQSIIQKVFVARHKFFLVLLKFFAKLIESNVFLVDAK